MNQVSENLREQIIQQALDARTEDEITDAICQLDRWMKKNPGDHSIRDAYEPLMLRQSAGRSLDLAVPAVSVR